MKIKFNNFLRKKRIFAPYIVDPSLRESLNMILKQIGTLSLILVRPIIYINYRTQNIMTKD